MRIFQRKKPVEDKKTEERRRYSRISNSLRINYQIANEDLRSTCRSADISEGGIRFSLYQKLEIGTTLKLGIYLQGSTEPVLAIGTVVWTKETPGKEYPFEAGIEFNVFDPSLRSKIQNHIQGISIQKR